MLKTHQADNQEKCCFVCAFAYILIIPHQPKRVKDSGFKMCMCMLDDGLLCAVCVQYAYPGWNAGWVQWNKLGAPILSTARIHVQLHSSFNREQSSCYKELLFPLLCVLTHVATTASYPWEYFHSSCHLSWFHMGSWLQIDCTHVPLISHEPAWGFVLKSCLWLAQYQ